LVRGTIIIAGDYLAIIAGFVIAGFMIVAGLLIVARFVVIIIAGFMVAAFARAAIVAAGTAIAALVIVATFVVAVMIATVVAAATAFAATFTAAVATLAAIGESLGAAELKLMVEAHRQGRRETDREGRHGGGLQQPAHPPLPPIAVFRRNLPTRNGIHRSILLGVPGRSLRSTCRGG
jgi:hypothetical protein